LFLAISSIAWASSSVAPELHGIIVTGQDCRFALVGSGGEFYGWVGVGATVGGWKVVEYVPADDAVVLSCGEQQVTVQLSNSFVREAPGDRTPNRNVTATVAEADAVLSKMQFDALWNRTVEEQKKGIVAAMRQQATSEFAKMGLPQTEIDALLDKMGDVVVCGLQPDVMRDDFARIYSEVYTKEELRGMANFYDTAAGRAWAQKQPDVQQKLMQVMMPRVMQGMPAAQKLAAEYLQQRASVAGATQSEP
jgi:hypothetical protein